MRAMLVSLCCAAVLLTPMTVAHAAAERYMALPAASQASPSAGKDGRGTTDSDEPSLFDCAEMYWLKDCSRLNRQVRTHPNAPIRARTKDGLEVVIPPGTPSAMAAFLVDPSPERARALAQYVKRLMRLHEKQAALMRTALLEAGLVGPSPTGDLARLFADRPPKLDYKRFVIYYIYSTECASCIMQLGALRTLQARHPKMRISVLLANRDASTHKALLREYGLRGAVLTGERRRKTLAHVPELPALWVYDVGSTTVVRQFIGPVNVSALELELVARYGVSENRRAQK